ncbi:MAG: methyltransferase domain-containing protein [Phycisphaerales bacterium]|nr:methyltransferase domain-containing protein [Phycisphaerales bacterium]
MPDSSLNKMKDVDNVVASRADFIQNRPGNLTYLLDKRYSWMNNYIKANDIGIEVGCGNGVSEFFIKSDHYSLTDYTDFDWIDKKVDALNMPYENQSLDFIVSSNMIHHLAKPYLFFDECYRVLKPNGVLLIQEINCSLFLRIILKLMKHEGYNYNVDPFDKNCVCNDPNDLWSGNNAIPNLLFDDIKKFEANFKFECSHQKHTEFTIFPLSGGVTAKTKTIQLPKTILNFFNFIDKALIGISQNTFALQRQIVLVKK